MASLKNLFRQALARARLRLVRDRHPGARYLDRVPGKPLDFLIHWLFPDLHGLRILQIGANDGVRNDPLYPWIRDYRWSGCLVEPMPDFAARLRQLHDQSPGIEIVEAAVGINGGSAVLHYIDPSLTGLPTWASGLATLDPNRARDAAVSLGLSPANVLTRSVAMITVQELLARFDPTEPQLVAIDTEGFDIKLATVLLEAGCRPRILHFEHACVSASERWAFVQHLHALDYETVSFGGDTTAFCATR
jgi:methyltransferase, FkbM family